MERTNDPWAPLWSRSASRPAMMAMVMMAWACARPEVSDAWPQFGGLSPEAFDSIVTIERADGTIAYAGEHSPESVTIGGRATGLVVGAGLQAEYDAYGSPDPKDRWMRLHWLAAAPGCPFLAWHDLFLGWDGLAAMVATGTLTVTCGRQPPVTEPVSSRLLWDPVYAPLAPERK